MLFRLQSIIIDIVQFLPLSCSGLKGFRSIFHSPLHILSFSKDYALTVRNFNRPLTFEHPGPVLSKRPKNRLTSNSELSVVQAKQQAI